MAAASLGITTPTLYGWLGLSDQGLLLLRGASVTIDYLQAGPRGQGTIWIAQSEVHRIRELMRVRPNLSPSRSQSNKTPSVTHQHITAKLGRPED